MFWWLYYTTADVKSYYDKPLIIWLQGGPGGSSTSYGNFVELGPLDIDLHPRNYTWVINYYVIQKNIKYILSELNIISIYFLVVCI